MTRCLIVRAASNCRVDGIGRKAGEEGNKEGTIFFTF